MSTFGVYDVRCITNKRNGHGRGRDMLRELDGRGRAMTNDHHSNDCRPFALTWRWRGATPPQKWSPLRQRNKCHGRTNKYECSADTDRKHQRSSRWASLRDIVHIDRERKRESEREKKSSYKHMFLIVLLLVVAIFFWHFFPIERFLTVPEIPVTIGVWLAYLRRVMWTIVTVVREDRKEVQRICDWSSFLQFEHVWTWCSLCPVWRNRIAQWRHDEIEASTFLSYSLKEGGWTGELSRIRWTLTTFLY